MRFLKRSPRRTEERRVHQLRFLGEQDGSPERLLKQSLADFFLGEKTVVRAYLAKADYGDGNSASIVLGLRMPSGPNQMIVEQVSAIFASLFDRKEHLDIIFLSEDQEEDMTRVCRPFFG